jgi:hypothetical protein
MPTLTLVLNTPGDNGSATSGTIDSSEHSGVADDDDARIGESITANERVARAVAQAKTTGDIIDVDAPLSAKFGAGSMETKVRNKKRKSSILEQLNINADNADNDDDIKLSSVEKENSKIAASNSSSNAKKQKTASTKKKATSTKKAETKQPPTKTLLDFFSSNKPSTHASGDESAKKTDVEDDIDDVEVKDKTKKKKKRRSTFIKLNNKAKPIDVHIAFAGEEKRTSIAMKEHCIASKYDMGKEPLVLNGTYPVESKRDIENFLSGFGKYCL